MAEQYYQSVYTGEQIDESIGRIVNGEIDQLASSAAASASAARSAYNGVKEALDNLPEGDTLVINDLTTGGVAAALSAEQGKELASSVVKKTGETTMTGSLKIAAGTGSITQVINYDKRSFLRNYIDAENLQEVKFGAESFVFGGYKNGGFFNYNILHTGNKPSGSYIGNGDATARTIDTGGIGNIVAITFTGVLAFVGYYGVLYVQNGTVSGLTSDVINFRNGVLTITSASAFNASGATYVYQVL